MRFDSPENPRDDAERRLDAESWVDRDDHASEMRWRHAPVTFRCLSCGQEPPVPWCQMCSPRAAA